MKIDYDAKTGCFMVHGTVNDVTRMDEIPGKRKTKTKDDHRFTWKVPARISTAYALTKDLAGAEWTDEASDAKLWHIKDHTRIVPTSEGLISTEGKLSPLQEVGASRLLKGNLLLADDQGSGKTVMGCVALQNSDHKRVLLITTKGTLTVWRDHINEWAPLYKPFIFHGTKPQRAKVYQEFCEYEGRKVLIGTHASTRTNSYQAAFGNTPKAGEPGPYNSDWDLCIVDEQQYQGLRPKDSTPRSFAAIRRTVGTVWGMTGTPVNDNADNFWMMMSFVNPDLFFLRSDFRKRFCIMREEYHGGYTNTGLHPDRKSEFRYMAAPYFLRRLKHEVLEDLPVAMPTKYVRLPLSTKQRTLYGQLTKKRVATVDGNLLVVPETLTLRGVHAYVADAMPVVDEEGKITSITGPSSKMDYVLEKAAERAGDPFVVYDDSSKVCDYIHRTLREKGYKAAKYTGAASVKDRENYVKAFQAGKLDVLVLNSAGKEGITLTAADLFIFFRHSERVGDNNQAQDRIYRHGQTRHVQREVLISENTVDESRELNLEDKGIRIEDVLGDKERENRWLTGSQ